MTLISYTHTHLEPAEPQEMEAVKKKIAALRIELDDSNVKCQELEKTIKEKDSTIQEVFTYTFIYMYLVI